MIKRPHMNVSWRIRLGFAVSLLVLIAGSVLSVLRFDHTADTFAHYLQYEGHTRAAADLQNTFYSDVTLFGKYRDTGDPALAQEAVGRADAFIAKLQTLIAQPGFDVSEAGQFIEARRKVDDLRVDLQTEADAAQAVVIGIEALFAAYDSVLVSAEQDSESVSGSGDFGMISSVNGLGIYISALEFNADAVFQQPTVVAVDDLSHAITTASAHYRSVLTQKADEYPRSVFVALQETQAALGVLSKELEGLAVALTSLGGNRLASIEAQSSQVLKLLEAVISARHTHLEELGRAEQVSSLAARDQMLIISVLSVIVGVIASFVVVRSVAKPLNQLTASIHALARNEEDVELPDPREDEFGAIRDGVETIRAAASEANSFKQAMDSSGAMVMVADTEHRIQFLSQALQKHFAKSEAEIQNALPNFRADQVIGSTFDAFHKNMEHQRGMVDKLKQRHQAKIALGKKRFDLMISPVFSQSGRRVGSVVEWIDVTEELAVQQDIDGVIRDAIAGKFKDRVTAKTDNFILNRMAGNVNTLIDSFDDGISALQQCIGSMADGDLAVRMDGEFKGVFEVIQGDLNSTVSRLEEMVGDIQLTSHEIDSNTTVISDDARALSQRTESQAASLEETAATMEEMSSTIRNNADNAQTATGLAATTEQKADQGGEVVKDAVQAMARIEESSEKMSQIISVIDSIAFQTNLLALNAAVEAARAGDAGKGFAVVASEVRTLAQRSGEAAKDIKELIQYSTTHVTEGVDLVNKTGGALEDIISSIVQVNSAIADITAMSKEQATGVDEISSALSEMDGMTQKNAAMAEQSASRATMLAEKSKSLADLVAFFRTSKEVATAGSRPSAKAGVAGLAGAGDLQPAVPEALNFSGNTALDAGWEEF